MQASGPSNNQSSPQPLAAAPSHAPAHQPTTPSAKPSHPTDPTKPAKRHRQRFRLHKLKFHKVKTWMLLLILVPLLFIDATLLRIDHIRMTNLRDAVIAADEHGDDAAINTTLAALQDFTRSHIVVNVIPDNGIQRVTFGTGPFYLKYKYQRDALAAATSQPADDRNPYGNIYQAASDVCQPQAIANSWEWNDPAYINCMMSELQKYPAADDLSASIAAQLPSTELYRHNYASPLWAPTLSGFCLLLTLIIILILIFRILTWVFLRIALLFI